jgi:SNF2 family DNA or RNA helicase
MNPLLSTTSIQAFLLTFPSKIRRRGKHYFTDGAVLEVSCLETDRRFGAVVRGSDDYDVAVDFDPVTQAWSAQCTCAMGVECKHIYAAMLALESNASQLAAAPLPAKKGGRKKKTTTVSLAEQKPEPQPVETPLCLALRQALGRNLDRTEVALVQSVQWLHQEARAGRTLRAEHLRILAPTLQDYSWAPLTLWRTFPKNDLELWSYCAWELRRRNVPIPRLLQPVTDFSLIETEMRAWQREQEIEKWHSELAKASSDLPPQSDPVDLRLMIWPDVARLQWKERPEADFKDLKQTHFRRLGEAAQAGTLVLGEEAERLWHALFKPYDYYTPCNLEYTRSDAARLLSRILRLPQLGERLVTKDGVPLAVPAEPLSYRLDAPEDESGDYRVTLSLPDGSDAPPVLLAVPGHPALYLTEQALFRGPTPHGFEMRQPLRIPAPAFETRAGLEFLNRIQLSPPPRLAARTRLVKAQVKIFCDLKPTYPGSESHAIFIRVVSELEGSAAEHYGSWGWFVPPEHKPGKADKKRSDDGLIPVMDRSAQRHFPILLESLGAKWDNCQSRWRVRLTKNFPEVFVPWLDSQPPDVEIYLDRELATLREAPVSGTVRLDVEEAAVDWFDLKVALQVSDLTLNADELKLLLNARGRFVRLGKKGWRRLQFDLTPEDDERLARLGLNPRDFTAEPQRLHALQLADEAARKFLPEQQAETIHRRASELKTRVTPAVPETIHAQLRPYQLEGFHFLAYLAANRFGGVLADDMGLGKTVQTLTWLAWLRQEVRAELQRVEQAARTESAADTSVGGFGTEARVASADSLSHGSSIRVSDEAPAGEASLPSRPAPLPSLVVCPKSVMDNWRAEAQRFCSGLRVHLWQGDDIAALESVRGEADLIVLNYAQLRALSPGITQCRWQVVILDEAQYIKNPDSQTAQTARSLQAEYRLALTGTPIENRLLDLWSILAFAMPGVLGNRAQFTRHYNQQDDPFARRRLAARVRPFLLRRTKGQVAQDLPDRVEEDLICEMEGEQKILYRAEFKRAQQLLLNVQTQKELNEQRFHFLTSLLRLRQICCHPALVDSQLENQESAKLSALIDMLEPLVEEGHKVLVFSQFVGMLDILRTALKQRDWPYFYLAGDTENRGELVADFQKSAGAAVFLISLKAGGFGLNLTAASYVVLFDPWWNPAVEMQAIDRTHRIGQTSKVIAYRLLIKDSIEQKIRQLQKSKAALAEDVLGEERFAQSLTLDDLRFLFGDQ